MSKQAAALQDNRIENKKRKPRQRKHKKKTTPQQNNNQNNNDTDNNYQTNNINLTSNATNRGDRTAQVNDEDVSMLGNLSILDNSSQNTHSEPSNNEEGRSITSSNPTPIRKQQRNIQEAKISEETYFSHTGRGNGRGGRSSRSPGGRHRQGRGQREGRYSDTNSTHNSITLNSPENSQKTTTEQSHARSPPPLQGGKDLNGEKRHSYTRTKKKILL